MFRYFENLVDPFQSYQEDDNPPQGLVYFVSSYLYPFRKFLLLAAITTALASVIEIMLVYYAGWLVDLLEQSTPATVLSEHGPKFLALAAFLLILRPLVALIDVMLLNQTLLPNLGTLIRWRSHRHVLRQSVGWFQSDFAGRISNRVMQTPSSAGSAMYQVFDGLIHASVYFVGSLYVVSQSGGILLLPMVLWILAYVILCCWLIPRVRQASKEFSDARSVINGRIVDAYTNIEAVKLFSHTEREVAFAGEAIEIARQKFTKEMRYFTLMDLWLTLLNGLFIVLIVGGAIFLFQKGQNSLGELAATTALCLRLSGMSQWIMGSLTSFFQELGVVSEGMETIAQPIALVDRPDAKHLSVCTGQITFDKVSHHYGKTQGGLSRISTTIRPGEKVGLVGRSGAGKSTFVNLILRFYECESGRILIDDQAIRDVTQNSLRANVGMVTQDNSLLHRSVRDNIVYGRPEATWDEIIAAAKRAEAHDFIQGLVDPQGRCGYDSHVGERGVKLSGGQRQRISLARVILKNAPILILDEATSALDSEIEAAVQDTLYGVMEGKTVIAIAHRLSTIAQLDRILVMDEGQIVEDGNHSDLLARDGLYAMFWKRQSGGFIGTDDIAG